MELSIKMGNKVLSHYAEQQLVCPPSLKFNLFTTGSTTAEDSFHGTDRSLFQHKTREHDGLDQNISASMSENKSCQVFLTSTLIFGQFQDVTIVRK